MLIMSFYVYIFRRADRTEARFSDRICSCHFVNGDKSVLPSIFKWTKGKSDLFETVKPNSSKKRKVTPEEPSASGAKQR